LSHDQSDQLESQKSDDSPQTLEDADALLGGLHLQFTSRKPASDERDFRTLRILRRAFEIGERDSKKLSDFIRRRLLPHCLRERSDKGQVLGIRYRELLQTWLESLPESLLRTVREDVLTDIVIRLEERPNTSALYSLSMIGFRNEKTVRVLQSVSKADNELGDRAIRILVGMTPEPSDRDWIAKTLRKRLRVRKNEELLLAAAMLADTIWLDVLTEPNSAQESPWHAFTRPLLIAEAVPGDGSVQDAVWKSIMALRSALPEGWQHLLFSGGILRGCHTPQAVRDLVNALPEIQSLGAIHVWRWCHQLEDVQSVTQVDGWRHVTRDRVANVLRELAITSSGEESKSRTAESDLKINALHAAMCLADRSVLDWVGPAIGSESNRYVNQEVMEHFAVLSIESVPSTISRLLAEPMELRPDDPFPSELTHLAAARLVGSSANFSSLELLLRCNITSDGHPFVSPVERAVDLAIYLFNEDDERVLDLLHSILIERTNVTALTIATRALGLIGSDRFIPEPALSELRAIANDASHQWYVRVEAIAAIGKIAAKSSDFSTLELLRALCGDADQRIREAALLSASDAFLKQSHFAELATLILQDINSETSATKLSSNVAVALGRLAARNPNDWIDHVAYQLDHGNDDAAEGMLWGFRGARKQHQQLPPRISDGIVERIRHRESLLMGNARFFLHLATLAPNRLLSEKWNEVWDEWMPDSRKVLAEAVEAAAKRLIADQELVKRAVALLEKLLGDATFAVRRSAARALAHLDEPRLRGWCIDAIASGSISARRIAAYAAGWLPLDSDSSLDNDLLRALLSDEERSVRVAADSSRDEARRRRWADALLEVIRHPHPDSNEWVLRGYGASRALVSVGDDGHLEALAELANKKKFPPNVRHWFDQTRKALEKHWRETTKKWPDPWLPWEGAIERVDGTILVDDARYPVKLILWLKRGFVDDFSEWGGSAEFESEITGMKLAFSGQSGASIEIAGRAHAQVLFSQSGGKVALLRGSGNYPEKLTRSD
jgi:HEAT repeat protein